MYLIVNNQELTVNNAYTERDISTNTLTAVIEVPYYVMDFVALKTLFMENVGIITKVNDDSSTESWDGFAYNKPPVDDGEQYRIVLLGNENAYQIERLRHLEQVLADKENKIASMENTLAEKDATILEKENKLVEQGTMIATQEEEITQLRQSLEVKTAELVSKEEEVLTLAEQCADLLYMSSLKEIETIENEVIAE